MIALSGYNLWQITLLRQEVSGLRARVAINQKAVAGKQARERLAEPSKETVPAAWPDNLDTSVAAKRKELIQTEHQLEVGVAETRAAAKNAEDEARKSIATLQRQLHDLQHEADSSFRDTPKKTGTPASGR